MEAVRKPIGNFLQRCSIIIIIIVLLCCVFAYFMLNTGYEGLDLVKPRAPDVNWLDKPLKGWGTNTPKAEFARQVKQFGLPSFLDPKPGGFAVWDNMTLKKLEAPANCLYRVVIMDEQIPHSKPGPHVDYLYYWVFMDIPDELIPDVLSISDSISYDPLKKLLQVRCHFSGANWSTLYSVLHIMKRTYTIQQFKNRNIYGKTIFSTIPKREEYDPEAEPRMQQALCRYHQEFIKTQKTYGHSSISDIVNAGRSDIFNAGRTDILVR